MRQKENSSPDGGISGSVAGRTPIFTGEDSRNNVSVDHRSLAATLHGFVLSLSHVHVNTPHINKALRIYLKRELSPTERESSDAE